MSKPKHFKIQSCCKECIYILIIPREIPELPDVEECSEHDFLFQGFESCFSICDSFKEIGGG